MPKRPKWFGVKTLYRWTVDSDNRGASNTPDLFEERVVLVRASSAQQAIERAEQDAIEYAATVATNPDGQAIVGQYLEACDSFEMFDDPGDFVEVFSSTELIEKNRTFQQLAEARLGRRWKGERELRNLFADGGLTRGTLSSRR